MCLKKRPYITDEIDWRPPLGADRRLAKAEGEQNAGQ
jgi:hypothetical protein